MPQRKSRANPALMSDGHTLDFVKDQYRHCKTLLVLGSSSHLLEKAGIPRPATRIHRQYEMGLLLSATHVLCLSR